MDNFIFNLQMFAEGDIAAGDSSTFDGIKYTALENFTLNISNGAVTGIASGKVVATIDGADTTPNITIDGSTAFNFTNTVDSNGYMNFDFGGGRLQIGDMSFHYVSGDITYTANSLTFSASNPPVFSMTGDYSSLLGTLNLAIADDLTIPINNGIMTFNLPQTSTATLSGGIASGSMSFQGEAGYNTNTKILSLTKGAHFNIDAGTSIFSTSFSLDFDLVASEDTTLAFENGNFIIQEGSAVKITGAAFPSQGIFAVSGGNLSFSYEDALSVGANFGKVTSLNLDSGAVLTFTPDGLTNPVTVTADSNSAVITMQSDRFLVTSGSDSYEVLFSGSGDTALNITNSDSNILITGTALNDTISNSGEKVTIDAAGGNDEIDNGGSQVSISGGAGDDSIYHYNSNSTIDAGDGNNIISIRAGSENVILSSGNDTLYFNETLYGSNLTFGTISAEISNASVDGSNVVLTTDNGSLTIVNAKDASLNINGVASVISGDETISDEAVCKIGDVTYTSLQDAANAANGGETITLLKDITATETIDFGVTMSQTAGEVTLDLAGYTISGSVENNGLINAGASRTLTVTGDGTISNPAGTTIHVKGSLNVESGTISSSESAIVNYGTTKISGGTFSGEIANYGGTLEITGGTFDTDISNYVADGYSAAQNVDGSYVVSAISGDTALNIANSEDNTLITGTSLNDTILNDGEKVTIDAAAGDDSITNNNLDASISGGEGNDIIYNYGYTSTISANDGNDSIENGGAHVLISGGAGDDTILTYNNFSTIDAGAGNNIISIESGDGNVIVAGAGNDTITGVTSNTSITGTFMASTVDGANVILTTDNGSLTIIDGAGQTLNINGEESVIGADETDTLAAYLTEFMLHKTAAGYPLMAALAFHPDEENPDPPTNYYSSETWTATSADNLQLSAVHYSPENPTGQWVVLVSGYGKTGAAMNSFAAPYLSLGVDVLIIDQRASGSSEGDWLTMGVAESADLAIWTQEIANKNSNAQITLHGVSMGAATVMIAAALSETTNVTSIIEDCGYTNIADVFKTLMDNYGSILGISGDADALFEEVATASESLTGYNVAEAVPIDSIAQVTVPSVFIHGADDSVISPSNAEDLYNASGAENKTLITIKGAGHAQSAEIDSVTYVSAITTLLENSATEIGASINSTVDNSLIRGTIYDDTISNAGDNVTVDALGGNDDIEILGDNVSINTGEGDNTVAAFESAQLQITTGDGDNYVELDHSYENTVTTGAGNDTLIVERGSTIIAATGDGDDYIIGQESTVTGASNWTFGGGSTVDAGAGNDYINTSYANDTSLFGGEGNDTIITNGKNTTIDGGAGDDYIELTDAATGEYESAVIVAGTGNNTLKNYSDVVTIQGTFTDTEVDGNNIVLTNDEGSLTVVEGAGKVLNINDESFLIMTAAGTATLGGKTFELTENVEEGVTVKATENGVEVSHIITAEEVEIYGDPESDIGKTFTEKLNIADDDNYTVTTHSRGVTMVSGISNDAKITVTAEKDGETYEPGTGFTFITDEAGKFTFGDKTYTVTGDNTVTIDADFLNDGTATVASVDDLTGLIIGDFNGTTSINGAEITISDGADNASVTVAESSKIIGGVKDGASITAENTAVEVQKSMTVNDVTYNVSGDADGVLVADKNITGLDENASLTVSEAGNYTVNNTALAVDEGDVVIGVNNSYAYIYDESNPQFTKDETTEEILDALGITEDEAKIVSADTEEEQEVALNNGGDVAIVEATETPVTLVGGTGDDTVVTKSENVTYDMSNGGNDKISALEGTIKLENYSPNRDAGIKLNNEDMTTGVRIVDGAVELANATVEVDGNVINLYNVAGEKTKLGFATNDNKVVDLHKDTEGSLLIGGDRFTDDSVSGASLLGGIGNDSIYGGANSYIAPGSGNDSVEMSSSGGSTVEYLDGSDTISNFNFADGDVPADTLKTGELPIKGVSTSNGDIILETRNGDVTISDAENQNIEIQNDYTDGAITMQVGEDVLNYDGVASLFWAAGNNAVVSVPAQDTDDETELEKAVIDLSNKNFNDTSKASFYGDIKEINAGDFEGAAELTGNDKNNVIAASKGGSTLNGGGGNNSLKGGEGADEFISASGNNTISNFAFITGDEEDETADKLNVENTAITKVKTSGSDLILTSDNGSTTKVENGVGQVMQFQSEYTNSAPILAQFDDNAVEVNDNANFYWAGGKNATVSFADYTGDSLGVDLTNADFNNAEKLSFYGDIKEINAGDFDGEAEIIGNNKNNIITASQGGSTLNGNGGNNSLVGGAGADEFISASGNNTISGFTFGKDEDSDKLNSGAQAIQDVNVSGGDVILKTNDGSIRIKDANNEIIQFQSEHTNNEVIYAQFGSNEVSVSEDANFYWVGGNNATVSVEDYTGDKLEVDLTNADFNDASKLSFYGDIKAIDATGYNGDAVLNGGNRNNVITGGNGNSSLWGGAGDYNDTLIGGIGDDIFIYGKNNGNDVVRDADENDVVKLDSISLDDLTAIGNNLFVGNDVKFDLKDGGSLTVKDAKTSGVTFDVAGTKYAVNQDSGEWEYR